MDTSAFDQEKVNKTHLSSSKPFDKTLQAIKSEIKHRGNFSHISTNEQIEVVNALAQFPLGRFILEMKGTNGYWTDYMITYPEARRLAGLNIEGKLLSKWEDFLLNRSPVVLASRERYKIFQNIIQSLIKEGVVLVSVPCGIMNDLLTLDYSKVRNFKLIGIDIDQESIELAKKQAEKKNIHSVEFRLQDAWQLADRNSFDLITSNGLNVYEPDRVKVLELYQRFFNALKFGGVLVIGVLTYPPGEERNSDWDLRGIPEENLLMEQILHKDILDIKWRNFRSSDELDQEFKQVGFSKIEIQFDRHRVFPTIVAHKLI